MEQPPRISPSPPSGEHAVVGLFHARHGAQVAVDVLQRAGIPMDEISLIEPDTQRNWDQLNHVRRPYQHISFTKRVLAGGSLGILVGAGIGLGANAIFSLERADVGLIVGAIMGLVLGGVLGASTYLTDADIQERRIENIDSQRVGVSVASVDLDEVERAHIVLDQCDADMVIDLRETPGGRPITADSLRILVSSSLRRIQRS